MTKEPELTIQDLARCIDEFQRRMEAIAPVVIPCVEALISPMTESRRASLTISSEEV